MSSSKRTKALSINLPLPIYEEFFRLFPEQGERTAFLREVINTAIVLGKAEKLSSKVAARLHAKRKEEE